MSNSDNGIDAGTQWHIDRGGSDPVVKSWSDERTHVEQDSFHDDWKCRSETDLREGVEAAVDEVRGRDRDRSDWDEGREHRDWLRERGHQVGPWVDDKLKWDAYFRSDPVNAGEMFMRRNLRQSPFTHQSKVVAKPEPAADLTYDGRVEFERLQAVKDALASANGDRADAADYEATHDLRAMVRERWPHLSFSQFLQKARELEEWSRVDPRGAAARFAVFSGAPASEGEVHEMVQAQKVAGAQEWLDQVRQSGALPHYDALEDSIGAKLELMNRPDPLTGKNQRTGDWAADLNMAYLWARDEAIARQMQQQQSPPRTVLEGAMRSAAPDIAEQVERAKHAAERARFHSRSVSGAPTLPDQGPATRARPGLSLDDDIRLDAQQAYYEALGR